MSINMLGIIREIEISLYLSDFRKWLRDLPADQNKAIGALRDEITHYRIGIENGEIKILAKQLAELAKPFDDATVELQDVIDKMDSSIKTIELLGNVLGLIGKVVAVAAGLKSAEMQQKFHVEEKAPLFLIEEVLYGVELTKEKLIITVVSGGCTKEGDFRFDVNKGSEGQQQYTVTVYRIKPDDCKRVPELIQLSYSREELGLDGHAVEFILRNKIGNTSQHRLNS